MSVKRANDAASIILSAEGSLKGKTKLQKLACVYELAGVGSGFSFSYHLYGPFSKELSVAVDDAVALGKISRLDTIEHWGSYSVFKTAEVVDDVGGDSNSQIRSDFAEIAKGSSSAAFELAVTALFLAGHGEECAWDRVKELKHNKISFIREAKEVCQKLLSVESPIELPKPS